ncbi:uncharacterized protein LOC129737602 [Uranotaenia lowii]|uniref:uncharacterized protein LOC129737602 n=1 Tax=Uranotaenia lowii TaxID=190385 RepID=UPI0024795641|nr:uncharacterized protein LOC129737602 [Uranotaenia lowii]
MGAGIPFNIELCQLLSQFDCVDTVELLLDGFVVNRSKEEFTDKQIDLLNKGLNYAVSRKPRMDQIIIDVETAIRSSKLSTAQKDCARAEVADVLRKGINGKSNVKEIQIAKELRRKEVFYVKADKGNSVVIMDKTDYNGLMQAKIDEGPYRVRREDPLPEMVKEVEKTLKDCGPILGFAPGALKVSAPIVPRIKGLPKIHKPGNEMREIISGVNAPTEKVAKWLLNEFKRMPKPFKTRSVTNTLEFVNRLQASGGIEEDEFMVSFDVSAMFPSVPVKEASNLLEDWLLQQHNGSTWKLKEILQRKILGGCKGTHNYLDDIIVFGSSKVEHDANLEDVLSRLKQHNVNLNLAKCAFRKQSVNFLGFTITAEGWKVSDEKLKAIEGFRRPRTFGEVKSFLGLVTFMDKFIQNRADLTRSLRALANSSIGEGRRGKRVCLPAKQRVEDDQNAWIL